MTAVLEQVRRILFVRTDRIGDLLMNLPAIGVLRESFPKAWITVLVKPSCAGLLKGHPDIDEVMERDARSFRLFWKIRSIHYDVAVVSNPDKFMHALVFLCGIPVRAGYDQKWGFLLNARLKKDESFLRLHEIHRNLKLTSLVAAKPWNGNFPLPSETPAVKAVSTLLAEISPNDRPILAVHAGTSNPAKRWPAESFARLCDLVSNEGRYEIALIGGPEEAAVSAEVQQKTSVKLLNLTGRLRLGELAAFLSNPRVKALVSADSGPVHIAWMSGTPVVALYAKNVPGSDPSRWGPLDSKSEVIYKPMNEISAGEVYEKLKKVTGGL